MKVKFYDLDESCGNALKEFCRKNSVKYSYDKKDNNIYEAFTFLIDDSIMALSDKNGITISNKIIADNRILIASDMFDWIDIV